MYIFFCMNRRILGPNFILGPGLGPRPGGTRSGWDPGQGRPLGAAHWAGRGHGIGGYPLGVISYSLSYMYIQSYTILETYTTYFTTVVPAEWVILK